MIVPSTTPAVEDLDKWKHIARRPHAWLDRWQLFLPGPWQVVATFRRLDLSSLPTYGGGILCLSSMMMVMVPSLHSMVLPSAYRTNKAGPMVSSRPSPSLLPTSSITLVSTTMLLSSIFWCTWKMAPPLYNLIAGMKETLSAVSYANPAAWECLASRIERGLAYRRRLYDVYLPPPTMTADRSNSTDPNANNNENQKPYILLFPGALVEHVALAQPAARLADAGHVVVVASAEPLRLVDDRLSRFRPRAIRQLQRAVERAHGSGGTTPPEWVLAGHSMGSFLCTRLAGASSLLLPRVRSIVLWGSAPFHTFMGDLSARTDLRVLVVQATHDDVIATFATPEKWEMFWSRLPGTMTVVHEIKGGTHQGFANYIPRWKGGGGGGADGVTDGSIISVDQQHREAVEVTLRFLEGAQ
jgi:hypothetical protein